MESAMPNVLTFPLVKIKCLLIKRTIYNFLFYIFLNIFI